MLNRAFWVDAFERAVRTACQTVIGYLGVGATGLLDLDLPALASVAGGAALLSLLTSVVASGVGTKGTAGLVSLSKDKQPL